MPNAQTTRKPFDARRFAGLLAGFDTGNSDDAEALGKARVMRQMAAAEGVRIVDLMERDDVRKAIDAQLHPARHRSDDLEQAAETVAALRGELTERMRDVRKLAELVREKEEIADELREELALVASPASRVSSTCAASGERLSFGTQSPVFEAAVIVIVAALLVMALVDGYFFERSNGNELGIHPGVASHLVRKGGAVLPVPNPRPLRRRLHRSGPSPRPR